MKIHPPVCAVGNNKKKKGNESYVHKVTNRFKYLSHLRSRPLSTDFHENWHDCGSQWHNHSVQFWF